MQYAYIIVFAGNRGRSLPGFDRPTPSKEEAQEIARRSNGFGLRYGARVKRVLVERAHEAAA